MEAWRIYVEVFRLLVLCGFLVAAAYGDIKRARIGNGLCLGAALGGLALGCVVAGMAGFRMSVLGLVAGGGPLMVIYAIGLAGNKPYMGAGDVKLMAGLGTFTGPWGALWSIYYALWIAGVAALCVVMVCALRRRELPRTMPFGACLAFGAAASLFFQPGSISSLVAGLGIRN